MARPVLHAPLRDMGFEVYAPVATDAGLGDNLALAAQRVGDVDAVLIVLADMPFVTTAHVVRVLAAAASPATIVVSGLLSGKAGAFSPPVLLACKHIAALKALSGDEGAKGLIAAHRPEVVCVTADATLLLDVDTPQALVQAEAIIQSP